MGLYSQRLGFRGDGNLGCRWESVMIAPLVIRVWIVPVRVQRGGEVSLLQ